MCLWQEKLAATRRQIRSEMEQLEHDKCVSDTVVKQFHPRRTSLTEFAETVARKSRDLAAMHAAIGRCAPL